MATNKKELGDAIVRILDSSQTVTTPEQAQTLKLSFAQNLATEIDLYIQNQITASFVSIQSQINQLSTRVTTLGLPTGSSA